MISGGPYGRTHMRSKVQSNSCVSLLFNQSPWDSLVKASNKCIMGLRSKNVRSCWTGWLNFTRCLIVAAALGGVRCHRRHALQVSTISLIKEWATCAPEDCRMLYIRLADACHQRICNILNVRRTTASFWDLSNCMLLPKSQADQSTPPGDAWSPRSRFTITSLGLSDLTWRLSAELEEEAPGLVSGIEPISRISSSVGRLSNWVPASIFSDCVGSVAEGTRGSRGPDLEDLLWAVRKSFACHLHLPISNVCLESSRGLFASQAGQSHVTDSTLGCRHLPGSRVCRESSLDKLFWQALQSQRLRPSFLTLIRGLSDLSFA